MRWLVLFGLAGAMATMVAGCGDASPHRANAVFVSDARDVTAMAVSVDGDSVYFGQRSSGDVYRSDAPSAVIAHIDVSSDGQRGLVGLAVDHSGRVFAGYTAAADSKNVTVAQILPGPQRVVWQGPPSTDLANGGHIAFAPDGRLTVGIGDLLDRSKLDDPNTPNGKVLTLDPDGTANQTPRVVSSAWNNPFAFAYRSDGSLWVGDNEPGDNDGRLARADQGHPTHVTAIAPHSVASGLAESPDGALWECAYLTHVLQRYVVNAQGDAHASGRPVANDCALGVVALADGRLVYSTGSDIRAIASH